MNNFKNGGFKNAGSKFGGKKNFGNGPKRENHSSGASSELFAATCSECHKKCDVPFRPSSDKPVYCSACFGMKKSANESRGGENNRGDKNARPDYTKLPREQRPARHDSTRGSSDEGILELKRQITGLELKLNRILELINPPMPSPKKASQVVKETTEERAPKVASKKAVKKVTKEKTPKKAVSKKVAKKAVKKVAKKTVKKKK